MILHIIKIIVLIMLAWCALAILGVWVWHLWFTRYERRSPKK